jgi:hypothetical protein
MDALELTMKCSKLLKKPYSSSTINDDGNGSTHTAANISTINSPSGGDSTFLNASFSDTDFEISRLTPKEGNGSSVASFAVTKFSIFVDDDRMSDASVDISKASRSGSSHSESSQECLNDEENETPYIAAPPEELGEVRL